MSRSGVGETALGAAMMRAEERLRPDRLFDDELACAFLAAAPDPFPEGPDPDDPDVAALKDAFQTSIAVRTRFYDDFLHTASSNGCRQVVLMAAGLDARAYRLHWPADTRLFEVDLPEVFAFKEAVIADRRATPSCVRITVPADLRHDWTGALALAGFNRNRASAWTLEGLLAYLTDQNATRLLSQITHLAESGSELALETASLNDDETLSRARDLAALKDITSMWHGGLDRDVGQWLAQHGWRIKRHHRVALATRYNRPISDTSSAGFLTAARA